MQSGEWQTSPMRAGYLTRNFIVRLPQVHDLYKRGLITPLIDLAREKGVSGFVGDGSNRWPAVHLVDCAHLYVLALEKGSTGARYHAVAEDGVHLRDNRRSDRPAP